MDVRGGTFGASIQTAIIGKPRIVVPSDPEDALKQIMCAATTRTLAFSSQQFNADKIIRDEVTYLRKLHGSSDMDPNPLISKEECLGMDDQNQSLRTVEWLSDQKVNHKETSGKFKIALQVAGLVPRPDVVELLLERGSNPNHGNDAIGETCALIEAVRGGSLEIVNLILDFEAGPNYTATTRQKDNPGVFNLPLLNFEAGPNYIARTEVHSYMTPLAAAAQSQGKIGIEIARKLIEAGAKVQLPLALHSAVAFGSPEMVAFLLETVSDVEEYVSIALDHLTSFKADEDCLRKFTLHFDAVSHKTTVHRQAASLYSRKILNENFASY